jgi:3',5'-cyclic-AMP phosphodiesterase
MAMPRMLNATPVVSKSTKSLRIAHITDVHVLDQANAENYFSQVIREINGLGEKPDMIINTGDTVMDENKQPLETVEKRWASWNKIVKPNNTLPIFSALGNHDVWYGPDEKLDKLYKKDKRYGKAWAMQQLEMPSRYYSFEKNGWYFIALDSINGDKGYQLDDEQFQWLKTELAKAGDKSPVCIYNHVPFLSMGALLYATKRKPIADITFPSGDMHNDHQRVKDLFHQYPSVKLCLSGHVHYVDCIDYLGVKYLCNGAVSGNWWGTPIALDEFPPLYTLIDLFEDGSVRHQHVYYTSKT